MGHREDKKTTKKKNKKKTLDGVSEAEELSNLALPVTSVYMGVHFNLFFAVLIKCVPFLNFLHKLFASVLVFFQFFMW